MSETIEIILNYWILYYKNIKKILIISVLRNYLKIKIAFLVYLSALITFLSCSSIDTSGTGSHAGNGIIQAQVVHSDSSNAKSAKVYIRKSSFLKDFTNRSEDIYVETDSAGFFNFEIKEDDSYTIEIIDSLGNALIARCTTNTKLLDTLDLGLLVLQKFSYLFGEIDISGIDNDAYVQVYGLDKISKVDSTGSFTIDSMPYGEHKIKVTVPASNYDDLDNYKIVLSPNDSFSTGSLVLPKDFWKDTAIIRNELNLNGLVSLSVENVTRKGEDGRISELLLSNLNLDTLTPAIRSLHLTKLEIANNNLSWIPDQIKDVISLKEVDASGNRIRLLPPSFPFLNNIEYLNVDDNVIFEIHPNIGIMKSLQFFSCSGNDLNTLPESIENLLNLKVLNVSENKIDKLPIEILNLNLDYVDVRYNKLVSNPPEVELWIDNNSNDSNWRDTQSR